MDPYARFSDRLNQVSLDGLFVEDEYGRRQLKPADQLQASLAPERLSAFGRALGLVLRGKVMIDLGCGVPDLSRLPVIVAEGLGAREYVGVDRNMKPDLLEQHASNDAHGSMPRNYVRGDLLPYLADLPQSEGTCFYLAGIEPVDHRGSTTHAYIAASLTEMQRIAVPGDSIVIGLGTTGFDPTGYGFVRTHVATDLNRYGDELLTHQIFTTSGSELRNA